MLAAILICEVAFWVALAAGLVCRYLLGWKRVSTVLLVATPIIDVVLLGITFADLVTGGDSKFAHGLSAFYIGFSITHGPRTIAWADRWSAHKWAGGPKPEREALYGDEERRYQWREFRRAGLSGVIAAAVLVIGLVLTDPGKTFWLYYWLIVVAFVILTWLVIGPIKSLVKPKQPERFATDPIRS